MGGIALFCGLVALVATKGSGTHKRFGKVFFYAMLTSTIISVVISNMPNHESSFLFSIGIFSSYFLISGYRSVKFKVSKPNLIVDRFIAVIIVLMGLAMILHPIFLTQKLNIVLTVFGLVGMIFGSRDLFWF